MKERLIQTIKNEVIELPTETQTAINASDWVNIAEEIGRKNLLLEDEINNLLVETGLVLIKLTRMDEYESNVEYNVGTNKREAEKIAEEIKQKIFDPIYNTVARNVEDSLKNKKPSWRQTLGFILSGGDYSVFIKNNDEQNLTDEKIKALIANNFKKVEDIRDRFLTK